MEKEKMQKVAFKINKNNYADSTNIFLNNSSRKSMFIPKKFNENEINKLKENNLPINEREEQLIKMSKRKSTRKPSNLLRNCLLKKNLRKPTIINKEYVFSFLNKNTNSRKEQDISLVAKYLSTNYKYFTNLKNNDSQIKVEKLVKIIKLEIFPPGVNIIRYGDIGDKFYIVLEGNVEVYKPIYEPIFVTNNEFIQILRNIKYLEKDENKYLRIKNYNKERNFDINDYENISPDMDFMNVKAKFYIEKLEKLGKYGEGFSFGEMALIKNCQRNATIKTIGEEYENIILLSIDKESYNQAIKEYQEKKIAKEVDTFLNNYHFISNFNKDKILRLFNFMKEIKLEKDDYLFHQNDKDDNLYFIINGKFEVSIEICFPWLNEYINYILSMEDNIIAYLSLKKPKKFSELFELIQKIKNKQVKSPMLYEKYHLWEKVEDKKNENNLIGLKIDEEKLNNNNNIYNIHIKNIENPILLGIEDTFEFKNKFYNVKCMSSQGEIKSIKVIDFIKIIFNFQDNELNELLEIILRRKTIIKNQIIQNVKYLSNKIINKLEFRYENLLNSERITQKEKDNKYNINKNNKIISLIKMKGYKNGIQDILDVPVDFLSDEQDEINKMIKNKKYSNVVYELEDLLNKKNKKTSNDKFKNNKNNLLIIKNILRIHKMNKNLKKCKNKELNLSSFLFNKRLSNKNIVKSLSDRRIKNNYSSINSNSETNIGNNTLNNILNTTQKLKINNLKNNFDNKKDKQTLQQNFRLNKINKKFSKTNSSFDKSKLNRNTFKSSLSFKNYISNNFQPFTYRAKIIQINSDGPNNLINEKNIKNNYTNNLSEININDKNSTKNNKEREKNVLDSKVDIKKDNSQFEYLDDNKDFYLCEEFSKKFKQIFNLNTKYNFPLIDNKYTKGKI